MQNKRPLSKPILAIICVAIVIFSGIKDVLVLNAIHNQGVNTTYFDLNEIPQNNSNVIELNDNVLIPENTKEIKKHLKTVAVSTNGNYTLKYSKCPEFFSNMKKGSVFCVLPDERETDSYFKNGFCGKIIDIITSDDITYIEFSVPQMQEICSKMSASSSSDHDNNNVSFIPNAGVTVEGINSDTAGPVSMNVANEIEIGNSTVKYKYDKNDTTPLLDGYNILCRDLELSYKYNMLDDDSKNSDNDKYIEGKVKLEYPSIKYDFAYHTAEDDFNEVTVDKFDLDFMTTVEASLKAKTKLSIGADDFTLGALTKAASIVDVTDVTEDEDGKIVLGTFLIGYQSFLLGVNLNNKVGNLSCGIAIQVSVTALGEITLEMAMKQSAFVHVNVDKSGVCKSEIFGKDHPNPVVTDVKSSVAKKDDKPSNSVEYSGTLKATFGAGVDVGICIFGMIPVKVAVNVVQLDLTAALKRKQDDNKKFVDDTELIKNSRLMYRNDVKSVKLSSNAYFKIHLGAKIKMPALSAKTNLFKFGLSICVFNKTWTQFPKPIDFTKKECSFGDVVINKKYTDDELVDTYYKYEKQYGKHSIFSTAKDNFLKYTVNKAIKSVGMQSIDAIEELGIDPDWLANGYKIDSFSAGVSYIRDDSDKVIAEVITGDTVYNRSGFGCGLSQDSVVQTYSDPDQNSSVDLELGYLRYLLDLQDVSDINFSYAVYECKDSKNKMTIIYDESKKEKLIVII